ncbi:hypothetical protein [Flavihumibacter petaseus]|uniref:Uncharacterized protein n=1 Tax=Flavihumibacter petaseus NBRC 106054 TaxID=1220578 RepID=A0A0E9N5P4_9BACT|nr:hypothetical protein [Flavihumibacter petaseus]GAO44665.1 hypothetical protein FPE01S_03_07040 [Flavihumibacter petaseus NBRC 106054]
MKQVLLLSGCLLAGIANGQTAKFDFKLGMEYDLPRKTTDLAFVGNDKDGLVNISIKKEELILVQFDPKSLNKSSERIIDVPEATRNMNSEVVTEFTNGQYFWLHSDWNKDDQQEQLYSARINVKTGKLEDNNKLLFSTTKVTGNLVPRGWYISKVDDKYDFTYSHDKTKLLISYRLFPEQRNDKKNYDKLGFQVFNDNMEKLWGGEFSMPYTEAVMDNSDFTVDSEGNAYLLAKVYENDSRKEKDKEGKPGYHFEVMKFSKGSSKPMITKVMLDDYFIRETTLIENGSKSLVVACTYSKKSKKRNTGTDGVFLANIDGTGNLVNFKKGYYEFPVEELAKYEKGRDRRKMERAEDFEMPNLKVRDVIVEQDGSIFFSCEEYMMEVVYTSRMSGTGVYMNSSTKNYYYYYDDIIATKIDANGNMAWVRKVPKRQYGVNDYATLGYKTVSDASGYYFLYLDNIKNMDLADEDVPKRHVNGKGGQVIVTKIGNDGKMKKELLFDTRDEDVMIYPRMFNRIEGNRFIGRAKIKRNVFQPLMITQKGGSTGS